MASSVRRMAVYLGLVEDDSYSEDYADEGYDDPRSSHNSSERYESRVHTSNRAGSSTALPMATDPIARRVHKDLEYENPAVFVQSAVNKSCRAAMLHRVAPRHPAILILLGLSPSTRGHTMTHGALVKNTEKEFR